MADYSWENRLLTGSNLAHEMMHAWLLLEGSSFMAYDNYYHFSSTETPYLIRMYRDMGITPKKVNTAFVLPFPVKLFEGQN